MNTKISLKDIAEAVGVSTALVSYVLNGKEKEERVNYKTAKKIKIMAQKLNYQPNVFAKGLKSGKSHAIGFIMADIANPFFGYLARTIENESEKKGYTVILGSSDENPEKLTGLINTFMSRQIDGFIIVPTDEIIDHLQSLKDAKIPFVLIDRYFKDFETSYVVIDNFEATYKATEHLIKDGKKRIGYVRYKNKLQHTTDRFKGYQQALKDYGLSVNKNFVCEVKYDDPQSFNLQFKKLLEPSKKTDAVVFSTNTLSFLGLKCLNDLKIRVPEDIGVFCFDQNEAYELFYSPVSYVNQPLEKIGQEAVRILVGNIESGENRIVQVKLQPGFILKEEPEKTPVK